MDGSPDRPWRQRDHEPRLVRHHGLPLAIDIPNLRIAAWLEPYGQWRPCHLLPVEIDGRPECVLAVEEVDRSPLLRVAAGEDQLAIAAVHGVPAGLEQLDARGDVRLRQRDEPRGRFAVGAEHAGAKCGAAAEHRRDDAGLAPWLEIQGDDRVRIVPNEARSAVLALADRGRDVD